jgi:rubrerythrin
VGKENGNMERQTPADVQDNVTRMIVNNDLASYEDWTFHDRLGAINPNANEKAFAKGLYAKNPHPSYKPRKQKDSNDRHTLNPDMESFMMRSEETPEEIAQKSVEANWARQAAERSQTAAMLPARNLETARQNIVNRNASSYTVAEYNKQAAKNALWRWQKVGRVDLNVLEHMLAWECKECHTIVRDETKVVCPNPRCNAHNPNPKDWTIIKPGYSDVGHVPDVPKKRSDGMWVMNGELLSF